MKDGEPYTALQAICFPWCLTFGAIWCIQTAKYFFSRSIFKRWGWSCFGRASLAARKDVTSTGDRVTVPTLALSWWETFNWSFLKNSGLFPQGSWIGRYPSAKVWLASGGDNKAFGRYRLHWFTHIFNLNWGKICVFQLINQKIQASKQLQSSQKFVAVLEYILAIGNHLNEKAGKEKAKGFRLSSLTKVSKYSSCH